MQFEKNYRLNHYKNGDLTSKEDIMEEKNFFEKVKDKIEDALNLNDEPTHYRETLDGRDDTRALDPLRDDEVDISDLEVPQSEEYDTIDDLDHDLPTRSFDPDTLPIDDDVENYVNNDVDPLTFTDDIEAVKPHIDTPTPEFDPVVDHHSNTGSQDITPRTFQDTEPEKIREETPALNEDSDFDNSDSYITPSIPMEEDARKYDEERFEHSDLTGENPNLTDTGSILDDEPVHPLHKDMDRTLMDDPVATNEEFVEDPVNSPNRGENPYNEEPEYMDADASMNIEQNENMNDSSEEASFEDELPSDDGVHY